MNENKDMPLHCMLCSWEGGTVEATHTGKTRTGRRWYICQFHAAMKSHQLENIAPITLHDRKEAFSTKTQEITTRWIQHQQRRAR